ncbi:CsbD family protein [Enterobacter wuhouensis]|uniref:CsbD family protein n=1 Tax=Enterobacter wuhouensis TaxID=2529381 RepID=UPI003D77EE51
MSDFDADKHADYAGDKAKNKLDELAGSAQQQFGDYVDSPKHQVKGAARKYAAQASDAVSDVTEAVRNNPLSGLIAAGAVGVVLGLLLGRK